jgi:hypothetical protein
VSEFEEHPAEVALIENDDAIEALAPDRSDQPLGDRISVRRPDGGPEASDAKLAQTEVEAAAVNSIAIMNQMSRLASPGCGIDYLTPNPCGGRAGGHVEVNERSLRS